MSWIETKSLREKRAKLIADAGQILKTAHAEKRELRSDEHETFERYHTEANGLNEQLERIDRQDAAERSLDQLIGRESLDTAPASGDAHKRAFQKFIRFGREGLNDGERAALTRYTEQRALSSGIAGQGGDFVPESFANYFISTLKYAGGVRQAGATVIPTSDGRPLPIPKLDDVSNVGELLGENTPAAEQDPATATVDLNAYTFSSKSVKAPWQLLRDSAFDVEQWLAPILAERIYRRLNFYLTVGTGSGQPQGFVNGGVVRKTTTATNAVTYNEILDAIHTVDPMYLDPSCKFQFTNNTLLAVRKLVDGNGNPLWNQGNVAAGFPETFAGYGYVINNDMANIGAGNKFMAFGNFRRGYVIRDVNQLELVVITDKYKESLQNGYLSWSAHGGAVQDNTAYSIVQNASS